MTEASKRTRRRWPWITLAALVAVPTLAVSAVLLLLATAADRSLVAREVLELVDRQFLGRIELEQAHLFPDGHFLATQVVIRGPNGEVIIRAARVETQVDLSALAHKRLHFTHTKVDGATLLLATDANGDLNIAQTFVLRHAQPPAPLADGGPWNAPVVDVDGADVEVLDAAFVLDETRTPVPAPLAHLSHVTLHGSFLLDEVGRVRIRAPWLAAQALAPLEGPLRLATAEVDLDGPDLRVAAEAGLGDSQLTSHMALNIDTLVGTAEVTDATAGRQTLSQWLAVVQPQGLRGTASIALEDGVLTLTASRITPASGKGELLGTGRVDLHAGAATAKLAATGVDAHALAGVLPPTALNLTVEASAEHLMNDARELTAHVAVASGGIQGQRVERGQLDVHFSGSTLAFKGVDLAVPGGRVRGTATLAKQQGREALHLRAALASPDLQALGSAMQTALGANLPAFKGSLDGEVEIDGLLPAPALRASLHAPAVSLGDFAAEDVSAQLTSAHIGKQMDLAGQVRIATLRFNDGDRDRTVTDLGAAIHWTTPLLHLDAQAHEGTKTLDVVTELSVPRNLESATLETFDLRLAGNEWQLAKPAELDLREGLKLERVELRSDSQVAALSLQVAAHSLRVAAEVEAFDLSRLPAALFPSLGLSGRVTGKAHYQSSTASRRREGDAEVSLDHLTWRGLDVPAGKLAASLGADQQLTVDLTAQVGHGSVSLAGSGQLDRAAQLGRIDGDLEVKELALQDFAGLVPQLTDTHATLSMQAHIGGTLAAPEVRLTSAAREITGDWTHDAEAGVLAKPLAATLALTVDPAGLQQDLRVQAGDTQLLTLVGTSPFGSRALGVALETPGKLGQLLLGLPLSEQLAVTNLPLEPLLRRLPAPARFAGTVSATGSIHGSARAPRGELALSAQGLAYQGRALGNSTLNLSTGDERLSATLDLHPSSGVLSAKGEWLLAPEQLSNAAKRQAARLTVSATVQDVPLSVLIDTQGGLAGLAELSGTFGGSLAHPLVQTKAELRDLELGKRPIGELHAEARWSGSRAVSTLTGQQPDGGSLEGHLDLSLPWGGDAGAEPLSATLDATSFELAPLSALARGAFLSSIAGRLDAKLAVGGTLDAPQPSGTLNLSKGTVGLTSVGRFREVQAQLRLDQDGIEIDKLAGHAGAGTFQVNGSLRAVDRQLAVKIHLGTDRMGVYAFDQLLGQLSSQEDLAGNIGRQGTALTLTVSRALFTLPQLVPRTTGPTSLDPDIVVEAKPREATKNEAAYRLTLHVLAPTIELKATDLDVKARADLLLAVQGDAEMRGAVVATGGDVNAYGRHFEVEHANVTFGRGDEFGPARSPDIDARASERIGPYRLFLDVTGTPTTLAIVSSTEPPLDREKVGLLLVSGSVDGLSTEPNATSAAPSAGSLAAASALGGLLSEKLRESLGPYMPLDVLTVDPSHLEAGKHITARLYVGAVENLGVTDPRINGAEIHANYKLTDHWALDSRYGTAQAGDFDLKWSRSW